VIGEQIGVSAFSFAEKYFYGTLLERGTIYPNPSSGELIVAYKTSEPLEIALYDTMGRRIYSAPAVFDQLDRCSLDISYLKDGLYFVTLEKDKEQIFVQRLVKH
jgi:hypothetical protein